jgi:endonuclease/exonuclease/phosphatase family metal-dependent hydrolase
LFDRAKALNLSTWEEGRPVLEQHAEMNQILAKPRYSDADKDRLIELVEALGLRNSDTGPFVILRQNRGRLLRRSGDGALSIVAGGRHAWIGWLELRTEPVNERAIQNTARVIRDLGADILAVVEAEHRIALKEFNEDVLPMVDGAPYAEIMLIDGNDERGIDVGLMAREGYAIDLMRSHVHDLQASGTPTFSRDCPEYRVIAPGGARIWVLINHLKSKGFGDFRASNARRKAQASAVRDIYRRLRGDGEELVAVLGDFNDTPDSAPLEPLLRDTDLKDISAHSSFDDGGRPGTFGSGTASNKIDYVLMSPRLFESVRGGGVFRKGAWPGVRPRKWETYPEVEEEIHAASDHHAIWADVDI